ncbi:heavy metal translocating P-type ATPase [Corynebacterium heidelbergense]|uniref:Cation-transporting P-type ATPase B n=1 Tax=Corynebacterium heidelbergense TaxID=2055947 RepID=A0A364V950_9CORY|nr:heavy metal translocating P-type ATPase [Corynebacterium heidelbergense]RAV33193.1 copper-translocating P-type ATPase [Corynebacterium heidelbergense]WCZ36283.1 Copper-exporting P-type ATPase A [Corynebacterium heidelbergense]
MATVDLTLTGMTCASCANRIERKLNKLDGVSASVNYATEKAHVSSEDDLDPALLVQTVTGMGYGAQVEATEEPAGSAANELASLRRRLWIAVALSVPVIVVAMVPPLQFPGWQWFSAVLAVPVVAWAGWPFHRATWVNARHGAVTMDTLITVGSITALFWSLISLFLGDAGHLGMRHSWSLMPHVGAGMGARAAMGDVYFEVAAGVVTFVLAGRYFEKKAKARAGEDMRALTELGAKQVTIVDGDRERRVDAAKVAVGTQFVTRPGERIATDGVVEQGTAAVDTAMLTGEAAPVHVEPGSEVVGGTISTNGRLVVRATKVGQQTALAQIAQLVEQAQTGKAQVQRLVDAVARVFVPVVFVLAAMTLLGWGVLAGQWTKGLTAAVAVLIIACPCALGLATPVALLVGTGRGAAKGMLIRGPEVLERVRGVHTVVFDKTGTLTTGQMSVSEVRLTAGAQYAEGEAIALAAAAEMGSEHPIATAIVRAAGERGIPVPRAREFEATPGWGISALVADGKAEHRIEVCRPSGARSNRNQTGDRDNETGAAQTDVELRVDGATVAIIGVADRLKPGAATAVRDLRSMGMDVVLLSGDNQEVANYVGGLVGLDATNIRAGVSPRGKVDTIRELQLAAGPRGKVAMVGDGINDSAALAQADVGMAMGSGTDAALQASDISLVRPEVGAAVDALRLARKTFGTIRVNLFWAMAYNVIALPIAAMGLLNPMLAGAAMALSSVFVVGNSLRLRRFQ